MKEKEYERLCQSLGQAIEHAMAINKKNVEDSTVLCEGCLRDLLDGNVPDCETCGVKK